MNTICFTGNLGNDCRKGGAGGSSVCNFSVAVKSGFGDKTQTLWIDCSLWGKQAESKLPDYLVKGQSVAVSGELGTREHNGKTYLTCRVTSIDLIGKKEEQTKTPSPSSEQKTPGKSDGYYGLDDPIPF